MSNIISHLVYVMLVICVLACTVLQCAFCSGAGGNKSKSNAIYCCTKCKSATRVREYIHLIPRKCCYCYSCL